MEHIERVRCRWFRLTDNLSRSKICFCLRSLLLAHTNSCTTKANCARLIVRAELLTVHLQLDYDCVWIKLSSYKVFNAQVYFFFATHIPAYYCNNRMQCLNSPPSPPKKKQQRSVFESSKERANIKKCILYLKFTYISGI